MGRKGLSVDDVYEMAMLIERNGSKFYRKAAEPVKDAKVREHLLKLAEVENEHEMTFETMRVGLTEGDRMSDASDEAATYLRAAAEGKVFGADPSKRLTGKETLEAVLSTAIGLEKDSIVFYVAVERMLAPGQAKEKVGRIIGEEVEHINMLNGWLEEAK